MQVKLSTALLGAIILLSVGLAALQLKHVDVPATLSLMQQHPAQVLPVFMAVNAVGVVLLCPGMLFILVSGAVYGPLFGFAVGFTGTFAGQCGAFLLGRHMFREALATWVTRRFPTWQLIERALFQQGGYKLLVLMRLSPVLPDSVMNYTLALTCATPQLFAAATATAMLPYGLLYAYLGSASSDIAQTVGGGAGDSGNNPRLKLTLALVSAALFVVLILYVGSTLKKALAQAAAGGDLTRGGSGGGGGVGVGGGGGGDGVASSPSLRSLSNRGGEVELETKPLLDP